MKPLPSAGTVLYSLTAIDASGRIRDKTLLSQLQWAPRTRLAIGEREGRMVIGVDEHGTYQVSGQGFIPLPAAVRRWCGIGPNDKVFLVADLEVQWVVVHPQAALDAMVSAAHAAIWGGEDS
ncbi:AbrB/MazE/SpoVT family DNA-binding domain-containing protein [Cryptosporangium sp. NPDC048952]|uniref:AbrB/MazE/SpoVT family DNA-binding domain-containing protein n=1 Tax=Cryptosporangium sp. NPDC048952 TaxID=3363961 RepID=UPI0037236D40